MEPPDAGMEASKVELPDMRTGRPRRHLWLDSRPQAAAPRVAPGEAVTLKEAAASLGVTPDNLRGAINRGTLKAQKMGRDWFVASKEVERYRAENLRGKRSQ